MRLLTAGHLDGVFLQLCLKDPTIVGVDSRQCRPALRLLPSQTTDLSDYPNHPSYVSGPLPPRIERMCAAAGLRRPVRIGPRRHGCKSLHLQILMGVWRQATLASATVVFA